MIKIRSNDLIRFKKKVKKLCKTVDKILKKWYYIRHTAKWAINTKESSTWKKYLKSVSSMRHRSLAKSKRFFSSTTGMRILVESKEGQCIGNHVSQLFAL